MFRAGRPAPAGLAVGSDILVASPGRGTKLSDRSRHGSAGDRTSSLDSQGSWKIFGDGPVATAAKTPASSSFNEKGRKDLGPDDVRFTTKGDALYAIVMGLPGREAVIPALAIGGPNRVGTIRNVELLGAPGKLEWHQDALGLRVTMPAKPPSDFAVAFKMIGA